MEVPKDFKDLLGPFGGVGGDVAQSWRFARTGQPGRAAEKLLPNAMANVPVALREASAGAVSQRGNRVWDEQGKPYMPTGTETATKVAGFRSSRRATAQERQWEIKKVMAKYGDERNTLYEEYRAYLARPSMRKMSAISKKIREYNEKVKANGDDKIVPRITPLSLRGQVRRMQKAPNRLRAALAG